MAVALLDIPLRYLLANVTTTTTTAATRVSDNARNHSDTPGNPTCHGILGPKGNGAKMPKSQAKRAQASHGPVWDMGCENVGPRACLKYTPRGCMGLRRAKSASQKENANRHTYQRPHLRRRVRPRHEQTTKDL